MEQEFFKILHQEKDGKLTEHEAEEKYLELFSSIRDSKKNWFTAGCFIGIILVYIFLLIF